MLTTDLALGIDPDCEPIFARTPALEEDFAETWYELVLGDMGPVDRCIGDNVLPAQEWQDPLPATLQNLPDYSPIQDKIVSMLAHDPSNTAKFAQLGKSCFSTFCETDYRGGCNGARISFEPEIDWPENLGAADALAALELVERDILR